MRKEKRKKRVSAGKRISRKVDALVVLIYAAILAAAAVREVMGRRNVE